MDPVHAVLFGYLIKGNELAECGVGRVGLLDGTSWKL